MQELAIERIEAQQNGMEGTAPWMVGEQLKEICHREPESAELIAQDLENADMSLKNAEKKIKAFADQHKTGNVACVTPLQAEEILRKFYGLPKAHRESTVLPHIQEQKKAPPSADGQVLDLMDFLG